MQRANRRLGLLHVVSLTGTRALSLPEKPAAANEVRVYFGPTWTVHIPASEQDANQEVHLLFGFLSNKPTLTHSVAGPVHRGNGQQCGER